MKLAFDIGANRGVYSDMLLFTHSKIEIVAVEPNQNLEILLKEKYKNKNVKVISNIISDKKDQDVDFYISNTDTISTASIDWIEKGRFSDNRYGNYHWNSPIKIKSITLDYMIEEFGSPDLIKIDVEGYESKVIQGLTSKQKEICFEWHEEEIDNTIHCCKLLTNLGYNDFGFVYGQNLDGKRPDVYDCWENLKLLEDIIPARKEKFGMIWCR